MFRVVRLSLGTMTRREQRHFLALLIVRSLTAVLDVVGVLLVGLIGALAAGTLDGASSLTMTVFGINLAGLATAQGLMILSLITLAFFLLKAAIAVITTRRLTMFAAAVERRAARSLVQRVLAGGLSQLEGWSASELTHGATLSMNAAYSRLLSHFATLVTEGFLLLCIAVVLAVVNPVTMVAFVLYFGLIGVIIQLYVGRRQQRAGLALGQSTIDSNASLREAIEAFREIFTLGRQAHFVNRFDRARRVMAETSGEIQFVQTLPRYVVESALLLGAVGLVASQVLSNNLGSAAATLAVFLTAGFRIMASLLPLQAAAGSIKQVSAEAEMALLLLKDYPETLESHAPIPVDPEQEVAGVGIAIRDVEFGYPGALRPALIDVNLEARPGEYSAIIGASGAGKSTLADLLLGLIEPNSGSVELDGLSPRELDIARPGSIAYVPQRPGLVSGSIAENVALGHEIEDINFDRVRFALRQANLLDHIDTLEEGVLTSVGKQSNSLSGGQIQRLGVARALYAEPRLLVLDEATSALDAESESVVGDSLRALAGSVTLVVIAHRLSTVQHADTVHVMEDGRIIASGTFSHLLATVPVVARYAELMALDEPNP